MGCRLWGRTKSDMTEATWQQQQQQQDTGVGCHFLLQGIFLLQGLNLCLQGISCIAGGPFTTEPLGKLS